MVFEINLKTDIWANIFDLGWPQKFGVPTIQLTHSFGLMQNEISKSPNKIFLAQIIGVGAQIIVFGAQFFFDCYYHSNLQTRAPSFFL